MAIIVARDEADLVVTTIPSLVAQDYPGEACVVVVDDGSREARGRPARRAGESGTLPLEVIESSDRPLGWVGKTWALEQGVAYVTKGVEEPPEWILFTDADILHPARFPAPADGCRYRPAAGHGLVDGAAPRSARRGSG